MIVSFHSCFWFLCSYQLFEAERRINASLKHTDIGSDNGLSPGRRHAIIWSHSGMLSIGPLGTNFSEILIEVYTLSQKCIWKCCLEICGHFVSPSMFKNKPVAWITEKNQCYNPCQLTHRGRDKMDAISQTTFSNAFSWMKMHEFGLRFHRGLFLRFNLTIGQQWFR